MSRGRKEAREAKYAGNHMMVPRPIFGDYYEPKVVDQRTCSFCHVGIGHWHEDDCLYRGQVKPEHAR